MKAARKPTITSSENSEPGACGTIQRPKAMNSIGNPTSMPSITSVDTPSCIGSPACMITNSAASASSSPAIALLVTQKRSSSSRRSEEHTSELQSLMRTSYAVFCLKKKTTENKQLTRTNPTNLTISQ